MTAVTAHVHITSRRITSRARNTMLPEAAATIGCRNAEDALPPSAVSSVSSIGRRLSMWRVMVTIVCFVWVSSPNVITMTGISTSTKQALLLIVESESDCGVSV